MSENCKACAERNRMLKIQAEGREAARLSVTLDKNPYAHGESKDIEKQYWEYGWIEENFIEEIDEGRALMDYAGVHIFQLIEKINEKVYEGMIAKKTGDELVASLSTVAGKLSSKLRGR